MSDLEIIRSWPEAFFNKMVSFFSSRIRQTGLLEMVHAAESKVNILPEAVWKFITLLADIKSL
jgi:hypothetical protein